MAKNTDGCPKCGMEIPESILAIHIASCDAEPVVADDTTSPADVLRMMEGLDKENDGIFDDILGGTAEERQGTGGLMEPDLDDEFAKLVGQLDLSENGPIVTDVVVTTLDDAELSLRFNQVREELMSIGEMINCTTQTGRDLHSQRAAYIIELRRRGLMT